MGTLRFGQDEFDLHLTVENTEGLAAVVLLNNRQTLDG